MTPDTTTIATALCAYLVAHVLAPGVTIGPDSDLAALDIDTCCSDTIKFKVATNGACARQSA
jgi:hypothetical protein